MTLIRVVMAKARCRGGGTISYSTPSARMRILNSFSNGSKCKSLAWSLMAIRRTMFKSLRTGALSARASAPVRSSTPFSRAAAAAGQVDVLLHVGDQRLDALAAGGIVPRQGLEHVLLRRHHRPHVATQEAPQLVDHRQLLRIAHGDRERVLLELDGHDAVELGHGLGDHGQHVGRHDQLGQADHLQAHLLGQTLHEVLVAQQAHADGHLAEQLGGPLPLLLEDHLHPVFGEETEVDQDLSDASQCHVVNLN